jgi:AcrR family transcriptional regulator
MGHTPATTADGRTARGTRNRNAIIAAARDLFEQGVLDPRPEEIAERGGVSWRSVYRHFPDRGELIQAVFANAGGEIAALIDTTPPPTLEERVTAFIAARLALVHKFAPLIAASAVAIAHSSRQDQPSRIRQHQLAVRAFVHEIDLRYFADDLDRLEPARRHSADLLLGMLQSTEWFVDRRDRGISEHDTVTAAQTLLRVALEPSNATSAETNNPVQDKAAS